MSQSVDLYVKYPGDRVGGVFELAVALHSRGLFSSGDGGRCVVPAQPWINVEGWVRIDVSPTGLISSGSDWRDVAFAPYEYEVTVECRGAGELLVRLGWRIFEHLTGLGYPMAYAKDASEVFAGGGRRQLRGAYEGAAGAGRDRGRHPADPFVRDPYAVDAVRHRCRLLVEAHASAVRGTAEA